MPRRLVGAALVAVALLAALVGARWSGIRVAGSPYAPVRLTAPGVGDCIGQVTGAAAEGRPVTSFTVGSAGVTDVRFADCSLPHVGEVVAFRSLTAQAAASTAPVMSDGEWCREVASGYRSHVAFRVRDVSGAGVWTPATGQRFLTVLSAPSRFEPSVRWAACAIIAPGIQEYQGSYVLSLADRPTPAPFGVCRQSDENPLPISCLEPHQIQDFATAMVRGQVPASLAAACAELIARMTGLPDPTAGGGLRVAVVPAGSGTGRTRRVRQLPARCGRGSEPAGHADRCGQRAAAVGVTISTRADRHRGLSAIGGVGGTLLGDQPVGLAPIA